MSSLFSDDAPRLILGYVEHYNNMRPEDTKLGTRFPRSACSQVKVSVR
jgi:hypothetical protein